MKLVLGTVICYWLNLCKALPKNQPLSSFRWNDVNFLYDHPCTSCIIDTRRLAFGDSYTYVQGTAGLQNYSFIGDLQNYSYTPQTLLMDEIVQNQIGTSAGGPNWVEYLTGCFSGLPSKCKRQLWDFAFAGSDVSTTYTPLHHNFTVSFENQIKQWALYAKPVIPVDVSKALVAIFIGINDISDSSKYTFPRNNATDFPSFYSEIIETEFQAIEAIYEAGYRDFLFMNLPPLERTPSNQVSTKPLPNSTMVHEYNGIISSSAAKFAASHPGTIAMVFDTYTFLSGILDNPSEYGIKNTTSFCPNYNAPDIATNYAAYGCLPIDEYFWYDAGHITWKVHEYLAGAVEKFLDGESCDA